ncbi:hypothetical protein BJ878DRAFT_387871, partial [Calycina marina]
DILMSYFKVDRNRFVDVICHHVVIHFLLDVDKSPLLHVLDSELVMRLKEDQLDIIAVGDAESKRTRYVLE